MLTEQIVKYKEVILKFIKITPKARRKKVNLDELRLDGDDPLLEAAEQLSEPESLNVTDRFNVKKNVTKDAKKQHKEMKKPKDYVS